MRTLLIAFLTSATLLAQSRDDWKQKYGSPVSETFAVRPEIGVKVKRGPNGAITEMLIIPFRAESLVESRSMTFSQEVAKDVLAEMVPLPRRGKFVIGTFVNAFCIPENDCFGASEDYENVHIFYNSSAKPGQLCYVDIRFKK